MWAAQIAQYRSSFRVLAPDLRGFGVSPAAREPFTHHGDLQELLDRVGAGPVIAAGNSYGGNVALELAIAAPERVTALVLVSTLTGMDAPSDALREVWQQSDLLFERGDLDGATEVEMSAWIDARRQPGDADQEYRALARDMIRGVWARAAADGESAEAIDFDPPARERIGELAIPVLLVQGDHELPDVAESMARLANEIRHAECVVIENASHLAPMERPEHFNAVFSAFLSGL